MWVSLLARSLNKASRIIKKLELDIEAVRHELIHTVSVKHVVQLPYSGCLTTVSGWFIIEVKEGISREEVETTVFHELAHWIRIRYHKEPNHDPVWCAIQKAFGYADDAHKHSGKGPFGEIVRQSSQ